MKKWSVVAILALAQFIMVLDSTVMNVSISQIVSDLHTTISGLQAAITLYTLTMAALMLIGAKMGDIWGNRTAFRIGSVIYGLGSLITAFSANLGMLLFGWSFVEGLGAILVIPAIISLVSYNYTGKARTIAFAVVGGIAGVSAAVGPLIGGFVTTYFTWRYVFAAETVVMIGVLLFTRIITDPGKPKKSIPLDIPSCAMSIAGMFMLVFGLLQSKTWGWIRPLGIPKVNGVEIAPFGISIVAYLILGGLVTLWFFYTRQQHLEQKKKNPLLRVSLLSIVQLRSGLLVLCSQYIITASIFFAIPIYLQTVLGLNALETGIRILPLSVALVLSAIVGTKMTVSQPPKRIIRYGQTALVLGSLLLMASIDPELKNILFGAGMFVVGAGLGFLASQVSNVNMSAVTEKESSEVGGLQGTSQNLGSSLGTALVGSVLLISLTTGFLQSINMSTVFPDQIKQYINEHTKAGVAIVPAQDVEKYALEKGVPQEQAQQLSNTYKDSQLSSLRISLFFIFVFSILSFLASRNIPGKIIVKK